MASRQCTDVANATAKILYLYISYTNNDDKNNSRNRCSASACGGLQSKKINTKNTKIACFETNQSKISNERRRA